MRRRFRGSSLFWDVEVAGTIAAQGDLRNEGYLAGTAGWVVRDSGSAEFNDVVIRGSLVGVTGTFSGDLDAAGGTFTGDLTAAGGTFTGDLVAAGGTFAGDISAATGTFTGNLSGGSIDIGGADATSFHVDSAGNMWLGAALFGSAPFRVSSAGAVTGTSFTLTGSGVVFASGAGITSGAMTLNGGFLTAPQLNGSGQIVSGGQLVSDNYVAATAGWAIDGNGNAEFNNVTVRGAIAGGTIDIGGADATSFHVSATGEMWLGAATYGSAPFQVSNAGAMVAANATITGTLQTGTTGSRIEIGTGVSSFIDLFTGDPDEDANGYINVAVDNSGLDDFAYINVVAPSMAGLSPRTYIDLRHYESGLRTVVVFADVFAVEEETQAQGLLRLSDSGFNFLNDSGLGVFRAGSAQMSLKAGGTDQLILTGASGMFAPGMRSTTAAGLTVERFPSSGNEIYAETSRSELKANQRPAPNMVPKVMALEPRMWDALVLNADGSKEPFDSIRPEWNRGTTYDRPGLVADEVAKVWPEMVIFNDAGRPVGLDQAQLVTALVQTVQHLMERLDTMSRTPDTEEA